MKVLISILFFCNLLFGAQIDTKLYEGVKKEEYYKEIEKQIALDEKSKLIPKDIIKEEKLYLQRVKSAAAQTVQIEEYDLKYLSKKSISVDDYYEGIDSAASIYVKQVQYRKILASLNSKSLFLKHTVEDIIEEDKPKLLSYQLQYAYYKLQEKNMETKLELLKSHENGIRTMLFSAFSSLVCSDIKDIDKKTELIEGEINKLSLKKVALQINLEKAIIEENTKTDPIKQKIESAETLYRESLNKKIMLKVENSLCMLKEKRNKEFFKKIDEIESDIEKLPQDDRLIYKKQLEILREIAKEVFGSTKLFFGSTLYEVKAILTQVKGYFTSTIFVFNEQPITLLSLIKALVLVVFGFIVGLFYKRWINSISNRWPDMSQMSVRLASNIGYYIIIIIAFIIAMGSLGIDMTSISLIAGALSIGIGFGLQTVVSNLIAGIILMFERTIRIGDVIEISDTLRGRVTDMRIRSTTIKTFDNIDIVIPNSSFIQNNVINWTLEDVSRRLHIPFGVAYGTDVEYVKKIILEELKESDLRYIKNNSTKEPEVWMIAMNSSSVDFELLVWVKWENRLRPNSLRSDFLILIYNALNKHGIQIPFPQLDLHVKTMPNLG